MSVKDPGMPANLKRFHDLGLNVQLTEVDVTMPQTGTTAEKLGRQAQVYRDLMDACLSVKCGAFLMWGVNDASSWRSGGQPLVFDGYYGKKPAYGALVESLQAR